MWLNFAKKKKNYISRNGLDYVYDYLYKARATQR